MLDIKELRSDFEKVKNALARRNNDYGIEKFLDIDKKRRELLQQIE